MIKVMRVKNNCPFPGNHGDTDILWHVCKRSRASGKDAVFIWLGADVTRTWINLSLVTFPLQMCQLLFPQTRRLRYLRKGHIVVKLCQFRCSGWKPAGSQIQEWNLGQFSKSNSTDILRLRHPQKKRSREDFWRDPTLVKAEVQFRSKKKQISCLTIHFFMCITAERTRTNKQTN